MSRARAVATANCSSDSVTPVTRAPATPGEIEPKTSEPAADVERLRAVLRQQFRGNVTLLCGLGVIERLAGIFEIGAGILAVGIEEEIVKPLVEVVMAGDIALGAQPIVALVQATKRDARLGQGLRPGLAFQFGEVTGAELQKVVKAAFGYDQPSVHVEFAERQRRIEHQVAALPLHREVSRRAAVPRRRRKSRRFRLRSPPPDDLCEPASLKKPETPRSSLAIPIDRLGHRTAPYCYHCVTLRKVARLFQVRK